MMKKLIAILLLGALLTLSFVGCNEQPNSGVTPNNADNTTTPEVTTPEVTTPNPDVTVPEETTPPLDIDPAPTVPEDNGDTNLPEDEVITFALKPFLTKADRMPLNKVEVTIHNEDIIIATSHLHKSRNYASCYVQNLKCNFPNEVDWHVDVDEQALSVYEQIKGSTSAYMITTSSYPNTFNPIAVYYIDGIYYFVILTNPQKAEVYEIYYADIGESKIPLSDKNTIPSYPENSTPQRPTESDPLIIELFGEERIDFTAEITACLRYFSDWGHWKFTVREGNLYLSDELWCKISYADDVKVHFSQEFEGINEYKWFVEENEQTMQVMEKITNSEYCYILDIQDSSYLSELLMYDIDGDYYFVMRSPSGIVKKLYRFTLN